MPAKRTPAAAMALGGILAALAVVFMSLGGMIPVATYVIPAMCMLMLQLVRKSCGRRMAWAWYGAVALLGLLLCPDKEAAAVFLALGYYPILKPFLEQRRFSWLWKALLFNSVTLVLYWLLMNVMGMAQLAAEFREAGIVMTMITLLLGNVTFFLLDRLLGMEPKKRKKF